MILGSSDRVAFDAMGAAILHLYVTTREVARGAIFDLAQIKRAAELGLGAGSAEAIELVTAQDRRAALLWSGPARS